MKPAFTVLRAMSRALRREQGSLNVPANNLYYAAVASVFLMDPVVAVFVAGLVIAVMFFPMSADPFRLVPRSRLQLWPLSNGDRRVIRIFSPWLNPVTWIVLAFAFWRRVSIGISALVLGLFLVAFVSRPRARGPRSTVFSWIPRFPGPLGELIRKDLRGLLTTLDFYVALIPALAALGYRVAGLLPSQALLMGTGLVLLAISTPSQTLFGLDRGGGMTRYGLLPLPGWKILLSKDIAFVLVCVILTAPLSPLGGLAGALTALAFGRKPAIEERRAQARWRLQAGASFGPALVQIIAMVAAASFTQSKGALVIVPCVAVWAFSLWWGGKVSRFRG